MMRNRKEKLSWKRGQEIHTKKRGVANGDNILANGDNIRGESRQANRKLFGRSKITGKSMRIEYRIANW